MRPKSLEAQRLLRAESVIDKFVRSVKGGGQEARFQLLEAVASRLGGFDLEKYLAAFKLKAIAPVETLHIHARQVVEELTHCGIHPALAVSALAREDLKFTDKRNSGAFYTDFRLAQHLADGLQSHLHAGSKVIDPACGAGILLTGISIAACGADRKLMATWLSNSVYAADMSATALRGAQISLSCLTDDVRALRKMRDHWLVADSLLTPKEVWARLAKTGFDVVVANPPWEKIKLTRHEFIQGQGGNRQYGTAYSEYDADLFEQNKEKAKNYGTILAQRYASLRSGEPDLYVAFTELLFELAKPGGCVSAIVPAGLIRSKNTEPLRRHIWSAASSISIEVFDNKGRFFEIDSRFKFLVVRTRKSEASGKSNPIELCYARAVEDRIETTSKVRIGRSALARLRPDLTIPEVKSDREWKLFSLLAERGVDWSQSTSPWFPDFLREVDMTRDRRSFSSKPKAGDLPLVEGRMVHQHRFGAKSYMTGSGRSAQWDLNPLGASKTKPQFWIPPSRLPTRALERSSVPRVGFCDITGQTNERSLLASMIPPGVSCGNKVPTVLFPNEPSEDRLWLWLAIVNSIPFDWMIRRVITTTVNYFHLLSIPLPPLQPQTLPGAKLIERAKKLASLDGKGSSPKVWREMAELRASIDQLVATAYGLSQDDLRLMLEDFPLLDGAQTPLHGEKKSTITSDLLAASQRNKAAAGVYRKRYEDASALGAYAYMPSQAANAMEASTEGEESYG